MPRILYDRKALVVKNSIVMKPITEFVSAVRQGRPTNDDRTLASFFSYEDGRGGVGVAFGDITENADMMWDHDGMVFQSIDQAIKSPAALVSSFPATTPPTHMLFREMDVDALGPRLYTSMNHQLAYSNTDDYGIRTITTADPFTSPRTVEDMTVYVEPVSGTRRGYIAQDSGDIYHFNDPTAASPFTQVTGIAGHMFFEFDGKLWLGGAGTLQWSIDPSNNAAWTTAAATGAWPNRWRFIGIFPFGQTVYPYVLIHDDDVLRARVAVLNTEANELYPLSLFDGVIDAWVQGSEMGVIHDGGRNVGTYDPASGSYRDMDWGLRSRDGVYKGRQGKALAGTSHPDGSMWVVSNLDVPRQIDWQGLLGGTFTREEQAQVWVHRSGNWQPYGVANEGAARDVFITRQHPLVPTLYRAVVAHPDATPYTTAKDYAIPIPDEPVQNGVAVTSFSFEPADQIEVTPWFPMGFAEFGGTALTLTCKGYFDETNFISVDYQLDTSLSLSAQHQWNSSTGLANSWQNLGQFPNLDATTEPEITGRVRPVETSDTLIFNTEEGLDGLDFTYIRFRFRLRGRTLPVNNITPNAYPMIFRFIKRPDMRDSFQLDIDVAETLNMRDDLESPDDLWMWLKEIHDTHRIPKLEAGPVNTWAYIISLPRILILNSDEDNDVVVPPTVSERVGTIIELAEPF
jgi:hypothetical protein